jgi:translocation and assembly module TamB
VKVTIGKELSRRLTVKDSVESRDGEITHRAIAEYKLLENFLARGFQDSRGVYGGELQFRLEFR